jgi:hypothetical protein
MIGAFARASRVVPEFVGRGFPGLSEVEGSLAGAAAASFIRSRMWDPTTGRLLRRFRDGEAAIDAFAEDYACLIFGLLELHQADGDRAWLDWAVELQRRQDALFWDDEAGGWFSTDGRDRTILWRFKEDYDGAEPAASSVSVHNLQTLARLGAAPHDARDKIERTLKLFAERLTKMGRAVPMMLAALSEWHAGGVR